MIRELAFAAAAMVALSGEPTTSPIVESLEAGARELRAADPAADARAKAVAGDFRLVQITQAWAGPWLPGVICFLPATNASLHADLFHSDMVLGDADTTYRQAQIEYATTFNREIVSHAAFPFSDLCRRRSSSEGEPYAQSYLALDDWRDAARHNRRAETLAAAARLGRRSAVLRLLSAGANPNDHDVWAITPLAWAALRGDSNITRALLAHGADPNQSCEECATPLNLAVIGGSEEVIALLIDAGADINARSDGLQPFSLEFPPGPAIWAATVLGRQEILEQLIRAGANPNAIAGNTTATLRAVLRNDAASLGALLAAGAVPNPHRQGVALIQTAAALGFPQSVRALLDAGATSEARSDFEEEMWRLAASSGRDAILLRLIGNGAHLHILPREQRSAVAIAIRNGDDGALTNLLLRADSRWEDLRGAIRAGDLAAVRQLVGEGAGVMRGHGEGELLTAIESSQTEIVAWLIENGADATALAHPDSQRWLTLNANSAPTWSVTDRSSVFGRVPYQYNAQITPAMLAFNSGPIETVDLVTRGLEPDDRNVTDPDNSYLDDAFRGYRQHHDRRIIERARLLGGAPATSGPQADQFLADICSWTREDAPAVMRVYLEMGYEPRAVADPPHQPKYPSDDAALSSCIRVSSAAAVLLLDFGADANQPNSIGESSVWNALQGLDRSDNATALLEHLLSAGADPNAYTGINILTYVTNRSQRGNADTRARFAAAAQLLRDHGIREDEGPAEADAPRALPIR